MPYHVAVTMPEARNVSQGGVKFWKLGFTKIENM